MHIEDVYVKEAVEEKIFGKHGIIREEIKGTLLADEPKHFKSGKGRYLAIGFVERHISSVYENKNGIAMMVTAHPSSKWQVRLYKRK
ncbi:hypothetical protein HYU17_02185 [Candidatus Woesearchaeota archaeon]|nr:hypothetical protein [Candidatus Woesearchaeota archaeon]